MSDTVSGAQAPGGAARFSALKAEHRLQSDPHIAPGLVAAQLRRQEIGGTRPDGKRRQGAFWSASSQIGTVNSSSFSDLALHTQHRCFHAPVPLAVLAHPCPGVPAC